VWESLCLGYSVNMETIIELPEFDTGLYETCEFLHSEGNSVLKIIVNEIGTLYVLFQHVRFFKFTALPNCTPSMISAYFKVVDCGSTPELHSFREQNSFNHKMDLSLKHYMIFLDETGCYEVFANNVT